MNTTSAATSSSPIKMAAMHASASARSAPSLPSTRLKSDENRTRAPPSTAAIKAKLKKRSMKRKRTGMPVGQPANALEPSQPANFGNRSSAIRMASSPVNKYRPIGRSCAKAESPWEISRCIGRQIDRGPAARAAAGSNRFPHPTAVKGGSQAIGIGGAIWPNDEARKTNDERMTQWTNSESTTNSSFGFGHSFVIASSFVICVPMGSHHQQNPHPRDVE